MKNYEVGIIFAVVIFLIYYWYKETPATTVNPTNATSTGYKAGTP